MHQPPEPLSILSPEARATAVAENLRLLTGEDWVVRRRWSGPWGALGVSAILHLGFMWLLLRAVPVAVPVEPVPSGAPEQAISLPPWRPTPREAQPTRETPLGPDSKKPDAEIPREAGEATPPIDPDLLDPSRRLGAEAPPQATEPVETPPTPTERTAPTTNRNSRLIPGPSSASNGSLLANTSRWGPTVPNPELPRSGTSGTTAPPPSSSTVMGNGRAGVQPTEGQRWQSSFEEPAGRCVSLPDLGVDAQGKPRLATVLGKVFHEDHVTPLVGAHLQIIGTSFSTFSNGAGEYELRFDPNLLEKCRVQYVRVSAGGYVGAMLTLSIGARVRSDDVVMRRR